MNRSEQKNDSPRPVLLATDLSARCDRAFDRALQLSGEWHCGLVAVSVVGVPQAPDLLLDWVEGRGDDTLTQYAWKQLKRDLVGVDVEASIRLLHGDTATAIGKVATEIDCRLIVTGMARDETLGRFLVGSTVDTLARDASQPLLVVRSRARGAAYRRILVTTDFSRASLHALNTAVELFPGCEVVLYHAHASSFNGMASTGRVEAVNRQLAANECQNFLDQSDLSAGQRAQVRVVVEHGDLVSVLPHYIREHNIELAVVSTHGRRIELLDLMLGSTAEKLLDWSPCDTLLVRRAPVCPAAE